MSTEATLTPPAPPTPTPPPPAAESESPTKRGLATFLKGILPDAPDAPPAPPAEDKPKPEAKKTKAESEPNPTPSPDPAVENAAPEKPKKQRAKAPAPTPVPAVDPEAIATAVAKGVVEGNRQSAAPKVAIDEDLSALDKVQYEVLLKMEADGTADKGTAKKHLASIKALDKYEQEWLSRNPGAEFNPEDSEHKPFIDKHSAEWDETAFEEAKIDLAVEKRVKSHVAKLDEKLTDLEKQNRALALEPVMTKVATEAEREMFKLLEIDPAKADAHEDQLLADMAVQAAPYAQAKVRAATLLFEDHRQFNPKDWSHVQAGEAAWETERAYQALADAGEPVQREGRTFTTLAKFKAMSAADQARHWAITRDDVIAVITRDMADDVKRQATAERAKIDRYASKNSPPAAATSAPAPAPTPTSAPKPAEEKVPKPSSPALTADPKLTLSQAQAGSDRKSGVEKFLSFSIS